jgi:EAL and modified HD-GYP domain-containing signal transduction protein
MSDRVSSPVIAPPVVAQPETSAPARFIGRQPIFDANQKIFGYELLFRTGWENSFTGDFESVGQQMIDNALIFGMDNLVHGARAFLKCTRGCLTSRFVTCLPVAHTVLEIPASIFIDDDVVAACRELKHLGYHFALDDFAPGTSAERLLSLADFVKLDLRTWEADPASIQSQLRHGSAAPIAKKVETAEEFTRARDQGYRYFQGYFFARPTVLTSKEIPSHPLSYLKLLAAMDRSPIDQHEIERLVSADASLCLRLLRFVNAVDFGARAPVSSIRQALLMIGEARLRKLITIAGATSLKTNVPQSPELTLLCLHRARFCELLAPIAGLAAAEQYLIGMLSVVDAMLNISMEKLLTMLPLRPNTTSVLLSQGGAPPSQKSAPLDQKSALQEQAGPIDLPLRTIRHYEQNDWAACAADCTALGISEAALTSIYLDSLHWAHQQIHDAAQ